MKIISDLLEHNNVKMLSLFTLPLGFALDALEQTQYFLLGIIVVIVVLLITLINIIRIHKAYKSDTIPIPIVINIASNESATYALQNLFKEVQNKTGLKNLKHNLKKYNNIVEDEIKIARLSNRHVSIIIGRLHKINK